MTLLRLTWQSLLNRKSTLLLTLLSISISVMLLLGVDTVRHQVKESFSSTVSGADLIVGARSGQINLLLYSVFRTGNATNNISWKSFQTISRLPSVKWSIPLSLGDSHRGYRVLGTTTDYFRHFRYGRKQPLQLRQGRPFSGLFEVVLGSKVARQLGYELDDPVVVSHGTGNAALTEHQDKPFRVVGILAPTGTPVDQTLHVSLQAIEAIHLDWKAGVRVPGLSLSASQAREMELTPKQITAFILGLNSRLATFHLQRTINQYRKEPLMAILPGLALQELWQMFSLAEKALMVVSGLVVLSSLVGLLTLMLASLNERRREMAILRSVGASPFHVLLLLTIESLMTTLIGIALGVGALYLSLLAAAPVLQEHTGLLLNIQSPTPGQWRLLGILLLAGALTGVIPGVRAYRQSLADGMSIKL